MPFSLRSLLPFYACTSFCYAITHVFLPVSPPLSAASLLAENDQARENDYSLARAVFTAAHAYGAYVRGTSEQAQWYRVTKMLDNLQASVQSGFNYDCIISQLRGMQIGGTFADSL